MYFKRLLTYAFGIITAASLSSVASAAVCPTTANTNTDCGFIFTVNPGGALTGAAVAGAGPYDGSDDSLVGVINNSGAAYTGSFTLSGSGNGGGIFAFEGDGICTFTHAAYCTSGSAPTGYEGPLNSFSNINASGTTGTVNITGLADGASTYFSLEGSPASINPTLSPEPRTNVMLAGGFLMLALVSFRKRLLGRSS